ncbi:uncharacterized protein LOC131667796 isoform X2 [Phymastichus coffea]|uniref:uncharacterized protein LOC131667796 isoform X2 n=1 Tax=Phymastichus coffea TaxID=108790 RepID=UPI00273B1F5B|nr:uncharacterized protein LOC131667796 isoform X2 [Phymastichus coffea]
MRLIRLLHLAGLAVLVSSLSPASSEDAVTSTLNCTTTDGFVSFHPTNASRVDEAANNKPKEEQQRFNRFSSDRRYDSYSGGSKINRRYELPKVASQNDNVDNNQNKDSQGHASSRHLDHDRRFLTGASGDYFRREQTKNNQRHSANSYPNDDYSSKGDDRLDYVNGNNDRVKFDPSSHYLNENRRYDLSTEHNDQGKDIRDHPLNPYDDHVSISKTDFENVRENYNLEKYERTRPRNRFDEDHTLKANFDHDNINIDRKNEWDYLKTHFNDDKKIDYQRSNINREKNEQNHLLNRFNTDRGLGMDNDNQNKNIQSRPQSRHLDNNKTKNDHDQITGLDLETSNSDENLNVYPLNTNSNRNPDDKIMEVIDKSLEVQPLEQHGTENYANNFNENKNVGHDETRGSIDKRVEDLHPVKSLVDHKLNDPIDYHHMHDTRSEQNPIDQNSKRHFKDLHDDEHSHPNYYKDPYYSSFDRDYKDQNSDRRTNNDKYTNYRDRILPDEHNDDLNFDQHPLKEHSDDIYSEKHTSDASASKLPPRDHHEKLHSNQPASNRDFGPHSDPLPERRLGSNLHPDERLSDRNYDRKISSHIPNRYRDDDLHVVPKVKDLNYDKYPDEKITDDYTTIEPRKESNISHLMTFTVLRDWEENRPKLIFPNKTGIERYRMATLHLDKGIFVFDFLRYFLSFIQPKDVPIDILKDSIEGKIRVSTLIGQMIYLEILFIAVIVMMIILMLIVPSTEFWLCCRSSRYNYRRKRRRSMTFFLCLYTLTILVCAVTMLVCNEEVSIGIKTIPKTVEAVIQDLRDYHAGTAGQLRKCLTRSLDVASEAILADLDSSQELAYKTDGLLKRADRAREFAAELGRETDDIRRDLERAQRDCGHEDRSLCAVLDPTGLHLALRLDRVARDDRLLRLRTASRDNLTELGRQARGEYLYVPHHIGRNSLEARNLIRREVNTARAKVSDEARSIEAGSSDMTNQLDSIRELSDKALPYIKKFEQKRWLFGFSTAMCVLFIWLLLFGAVCCRCGCSEGRVRPTLLWFIFFSTFVSIGLWLVVMMVLTIASHTEMLLCRPLDDPEFRTVEAILQTRPFLGKRLSVPLKDLFEKCEENDAAYPAYQLHNSGHLEQLTSHWTWNGLTRAFSRLRVDLTGLRILSPNLRERLQNLLYASGPNLTEHRIMIQGSILNKDLNALSDQVENVARQLTDRRTARTFQTIAAQMRDLLSRRVKPLMKMQDELVYHLATLELHLQPLQEKVNQTMLQLRNVQYFIDNQGDKIAQLKTKAFVDRLSSYLDEWRAHVLTEMSTKVSKCRPLWDILQGIKLLICSHILGPLNGFWFATFICAMTLVLCTPSAHSVASGYHRVASSKGSVLLPSRQGSPDTVVMERETWQTPPPPSIDSW